MTYVLCYNELEGIVSRKNVNDNAQNLLERARSGEQKAIDLLCSRYWIPLFRCAYRFTGNRQEAEDLVQEAFCRVLAHLGNFRGDNESQFFSYLRVTLRHIAIDRFRSQRDFTFIFLEEGNLAKDPQWEESLLEDQVLSYLKGCLAELPLEWQDILYLRFTCKWSISKIARFFGCNRRAVKQMEQNILITLRQKLEEKGFLRYKKNEE
ncbi:MAG: sigma-70 family RNA polymerase sigma factor [Coprothermobacterota bacterium]|nr:sigma-70 family RNA polymerase sigma factor [Coprothermobacterota bacterium]